MRHLRVPFTAFTILAGVATAARVAEASRMKRGVLREANVTLPGPEFSAREAPETSAWFAECGKQVNGRAPVITMLSGTGEGKSTLANVMTRTAALAKTAAPGEADSVTSRSCIYKTSWFYPYDKSDPLNVIDTPGFGDSRADMVEQNHNGIVDTFKKAKRLHAILWVLNYQDPKLREGRQQAFKFVRSYFGKSMYQHLVFVYTRFKWRVEQRRGPDQTGEIREKAMKKQHESLVEVLLREVEAQYWPNADVPEESKRLVRAIPYFGINSYVEEYDDKFLFADGDMTKADYNEDDPDQSDGVFNPEKSFKPNSATQLFKLKEEVNRIWDEEDPLDVRFLRPLQQSCESGAADSEATPSAIFGQHIVDCFLGQLYRVLYEEVLERVRILEKGKLRAIFGVKLITDEMGAVGTDVYSEALAIFKEKVGLTDADLEIVADFTTFESYDSCFQISSTAHGLDISPVAEHMYKCLAGIRSGRNPQKTLQEAMYVLFTSVRSNFMQRLYAVVKAMPEEKRYVILEGPHKVDFETLMKDPIADQLAETNRQLLDLQRQIRENQEASEAEKQEWQRQIEELEERREKEIADLEQKLEDANNKKR